VDDLEVTDAAPRTAPGRTVADRYRLLSELGRGGTGVVWRAEDLLLGRAVAVKEVLLPLSAPVPEQQVLRERTVREARSAARLRSPGVVTIFDVLDVAGRPFIVMELVDGRTLAETVREDGPLPVAAAARVGLAVLDALAAAHASGVVHRDVKPSNVLMASDGRVVLTDFGIAQSAGDPSLTSTGLLIGSPGYVAPERVAGAPAGPAADMWGLGATLFSAVEGRAAYDKGEAMPTLMAVARDDRAASPLAGALRPALDRLLEPDPARRAGVDETRALLRDAVAGREVTTASLPPVRVAAAPASPAPAPIPAPVPAPTSRLAVPPRRSPYASPVPSRRRSPVPLVAGGLVLLIAVGAAVLLSRSSGTGTRPAAGAKASQGPVGPPSGLPSTASSPSASPGSALPSPGSRSSPASSPTSASTLALAGASGPPSALPTPGQVGTGGGPAAPVAAPVPADWRPRPGPAGSTAYLPPTWTGRAVQGGTQYADPATGISVLVAYAQVAKPDPVADWRNQAASASQRFSGYREVSIRPVAYRGYNTADWEFTYNGGHALDRGFVANGHGQALFLQSRPEQWAQARQVFDMIAAAFQPAP